MSFRKRRNSGKPCGGLVLEQLVDRITPSVTYTWVGEPGTNYADWTSQACWDSGDGTPGDDGYPGGPGHTGDYATFDTLQSLYRKPKIYAGTDITINFITSTSNWTADIAVDGTLTLNRSYMCGSGSFSGDGTINFDYFHGIDYPSVPNHSVRDSFGVKTKAVQVNGWLDFSGSGQVGYDAGDGGSWWVTDTGKMDLQGSHALGSNVEIDGAFSAPGPTSAALNHAGAADPGNYHLKSFSVYGGTLEVLDGISFSLTGTKYTQGVSGNCTLRVNASFSLGDNTSYSDGGTSYDKNVDVHSGTFKMYSGSALTAANGDVRFEFAHLDIYSPGAWVLGGVSYAGKVYISAGTLGTTRTVTFTNNGTQINFNDYSPTGATNITQQGVEFDINGNLVLGTNAAVSDRVQDRFYVTDDCTIGTGVTLAISGTPPPGAGRNFSWAEIYCVYGNLTGTFSSISPPPAGWQWARGGPVYDDYSLGIAWDPTR